MTVHLVKLCVGVTEPEELSAWQKRRWNESKKAGRKPEIRHVTRNTPKRAEEILDGGSIYWVMKGVIRVRQRITGIEAIVWDGGPHCKLVLDRKLVRVAPRPMRAFQGWRYLEPKDAPPDLSIEAFGDVPTELARQLREAGAW